MYEPQWVDIRGQAPLAETADIADILAIGLN